MPEILTLTNDAMDHLQSISDGKHLRISVKKGGCTGHMYDIDYADHPEKFDETVMAGDTKVYVDPSAVLFLIGSEMDYKKSRFSEGFTFMNPNEKGRCGCGESFYV